MPMLTLTRLRLVAIGALFCLANLALAAEILEADLSPAAKKHLQQLFEANPLLAEVTLGAAESTGGGMLHKAKVTAKLKGKLDTKALFAHLSAKDAPPGVLVEPSDPMPELAPGSYLVIVYGVEIVNSFPGLRVPLFGRIMKPKPSYNYFIQRNGTEHCAWPASSREARYLRQLAAGK